MKSLSLGKQTKKMQMTPRKKKNTKKTEQIAPKKRAMITILVLFNLTPYPFQNEIISNRLES